MEHPFLIIGATHLIALMSPGPDAALIVNNSIRLSKEKALWAAFGISCGILVHTILALTGMSVLIQEVPWIKAVLQFCGGSFLLYLGISSLKSARQHHSFTTAPSEGQPAQPNISPNSMTIWFQGLATNVLNPKALVYFISIFSSVVTVSSSFTFKALMAFEMFGLSMLWFSFLALVLSSSSVQQKLGRMNAAILSLTGVLFIAVGCAILMTGLLTIIR
ncbi:hypothetical protein GZ77_25005 [Endozoicomonas montiporae]|uniref:Lysine transporter LysE n=2 Tax=Endozoicomonas montiporae TaxID=1027273 RepID=A0A081MYV4_9GAMM|nr:hypothetical protein GZ77_25005 [Endozoicomonas montiporae]